MDSIEPAKDFRRALGAFATGVTVVTTTGAGGEPIGVTASSFNSVSVDPPLVLWSLARTSMSHDAFRASGHFAIHVLAASQEAVSNRFARSGEDKFCDVRWRPGVLGSPLLAEHAAVFECRTQYQYEGGDHVILVGEVLRFDVRDEAPLLFHGGRYAERRPRPGPATRGTVDLQSGEFEDDFLLYLLARAQFQTSRPVRDRMRELGIDQQDHLVLVALTMHKTQSAQGLRQVLDHTGLEPDDRQLDGLLTRGLLLCRDGLFELADEGRGKLIELLAVGQAYEADIADRLTRGEMAELKQLLRRLVELTGKDVPLAWRG